jgi:hypothetical protein
MRLMSPAAVRKVIPVGSNVEWALRKAAMPLVTGRDV